MILVKTCDRQNGMKTMKAVTINLLIVIGLSLLALPATHHAAGLFARHSALLQKSDDEAETEAALKKLTTEEQSVINSTGSPNDRAKNYIRVASGRLKNARTFVDQEKSSEAIEEVKVFSAIITQAGKYFASVKARDKSHKTIELGLREHLRQLDSLRRDITFEYADSVEAAMKVANRVRLQAINALVGDGPILSTDPDKKPQ
jgi:hypothetical protein